LAKTCAVGPAILPTSLAAHYLLLWSIQHNQVITRKLIQHCAHWLEQAVEARNTQTQGVEKPQPTEQPADQPTDQPSSPGFMLSLSAWTFALLARLDK
jgi:hypothetical protein